MSLSLNTLKPHKSTTKNRKKVGRGNASGHGTFSGRGTKGQKSRSGVSRLKLKRLGARKLILSTPKTRGFKSLTPKAQSINLVSLNKNFKEGETITQVILMRKGLIKNQNTGVKILGMGNLTVKNLTFKGVLVSEAAKSKIEAAGGKID